MDQIASSTPLISLHAVALDTETTGLDLREARLLQIAAICLRGTERSTTAPFTSLVDPGIAIPPLSTAIHGITDDAIQGAPGFRDIWEALNGFIGPRILVGYRTGFDVSILRRECELAGFAWPDRQRLCVRVLSKLVAPKSLPDDSLETLALWLGVTIEDRHTALGDAKAAADIWARLIPLLHQKGIKTLGEALAAGQASTVMQDISLTAANIEADMAPLKRDAPVIRIDSYPYSHRLGHVMSAPAQYATANTGLQDAARLLIEKRISSVLVETDGRTGIVTERDILRGFAAQQPDAPPLTLGRLMNHPLHSMPAESHLYRAIGRMNRLNIRHLAVTGEGGEVVGMVTPRNLLRERATEAILLGDEIDAAASGADLAAARAKLTPLAQGLQQDKLDAHGICAVISAELCHLTRRAAELAEQQMQAQGKGPPPVPYAVMVLGSGGRGESLLLPDQDNAIVYASGAPDSPEDRWFAELGQRMADLLDLAGVPYCKGGVMASNEAWRKSKAGWQQEIGQWVRRSRPEDLLKVDIFFDGVPVHGDASLADEIWEFAYASGHSSKLFQQLLTELARNWRPPLGVFGRFRTNKDDRIDMKLGGLLPIISGARVLSIKHKILARNTVERLHGAALTESMSADAAETIIGGHEQILKAILTQQFADAANGVPLSNNVETARLSRGEKWRLRRAINDIAILIDAIAEARL